MTQRWIETFNGYMFDANEVCSVGILKKTEYLLSPEKVLAVDTYIVVFKNGRDVKLMDSVLEIDGAPAPQFERSRLVELLKAQEGDRNA